MLKSNLINAVDVFVAPDIDTEQLSLFLSSYIPENPQIRFSVIERILLGLKL